MPRTQLSLSDCQLAARRASAAPHGRTALRAIRPKGVTGIFRARAPLALVLYAAALENRVVWQGPHGFALLEPPAGRPEAWRHMPGMRPAALRWLDRYWGIVLFALPSAVGVAVAALMALVPSLRFAALLVVLCSMVYTLIVLSSMAVWQLFFGRDEEPSARARGLIAADRWTMPLLHQEQEHRIDELLDQVKTRLHRLVTAKVRQDAADQGGQVGPVRLSTRLICLHTGVTTEEARRRLAVARSVIDRDHSVLLFDARADDLPSRPARPPAFFRFYTFSVLIAVMAIAYLVMVFERSHCTSGSGCGSAPATYSRALAWVAYRMVWQDAPGVVGTNVFTVVLGWLLTLVLPTAIAVSVVAFRAQANFVQREQQNQQSRENHVGSTRVLVVTVTDMERDAVLDAIENHTRRVVEPRYDGPVPVFAMGAVNDAELFVVQAGSQGITSPAAAPFVTAEAIRHIGPHYALIVGICYGLQPDDQKIGDILVSEKIRDLDHGKMVEVDGQAEERLRGETVVPSAMLLNTLKAAQRGWTRQSPIPVSFGLMLSWNKLLNAKPVVDDITKRHPDAIGGDMEGIGFQSSARAAGVESILIKAICDWGHDKTHDAHGFAAGNAAQFLVHLAVTGALSRTPAERRGT